MRSSLCASLVPAILTGKLTSWSESTVRGDKQSWLDCQVPQMAERLKMCTIVATRARERRKERGQQRCHRKIR